MSYTNGITSAQQGFDAVETAVTASTGRAVKTEQSAASLVSESTQTSGSSSSSAVSLSTASGVMAQALSGSDDIRPEKVAALQQSIAAGTYNVSAADVADKVISALLQ